MHTILQFAVDQAQVECQVRIFQEEGHDDGVSIADAPDPLVPDQEDQVTMKRRNQLRGHPCRWTGQFTSEGNRLQTGSNESLD